MNRKAAAAKENFVIIPDHVLSNDNLTYAQKIVYGRLMALWSNAKGHCWASNSYIAETSYVTEGTVAEAVPRLASLGLIVIENSGSKYRMIWPPQISTPPKTTAVESTYSPENHGSSDGVLSENPTVTLGKPDASSRESRRKENTYVNMPAEKAKVAERVLAYHEERRKAMTGAREITKKAKIECLNFIGALLTDDAWTEERLMRVVDGHLADGSFWREEGHTHPRYAFRDEVNAERMEAMCAPLGLEPEDSEDDWPSVEEQEEPETWEGLKQPTGGGDG